MENKTTKQKHLTFADRNRIQGGLSNQLSFKQIARQLEKSPSTISREVKAHMFVARKPRAYARFFNDCLYRKTCRVKYLCDDFNCLKESCSLCGKCIYICDKYESEVCEKREKSPYVCNGCSNIAKCNLEKRFYDSIKAQQQYEEVLKSTREGIAISAAERDFLGDLLRPLLRRGQSIHHIYMNNKNLINVDEKTLYNYIENGVFEDINNLDLPMQVRYKKRKNSNYYRLKIDKGCYVNRNYDCFKNYLSEFPDTPVVEIDSVEGLRDETPAILTIHFVNCGLQLGFYRDHNDAQSVIDIFNNLYDILGERDFKKLFPLLLADRGCEFTNPKAIERTLDGKTKTNVFFCNSMSSFQKPHCEKNHVFMRRVIPKGKSIAFMNQEKTSLMMNHINNYTRSSLGDNTPYKVFEFIYGKNIIEKLGIKYISPNNVLLKPSLVK
ncbi:IS30 family transposase [bacterium]|nr:IS30 family transposase [bacterium]